jgi:hypothetical protein
MLPFVPRRRRAGGPNATDVELSPEVHRHEPEEGLP